MLVLTEKISAEAQRLWRRLAAGQIEHQQIVRAAHLRDLPAIAVLGQEPVQSCGINDLQNRSLSWGEEFSTHAHAFLAICLADLIECHSQCPPELVCALDLLEQWQGHPTNQARQNLEWAYQKARPVFKLVFLQMRFPAYRSTSTASFGYAVSVLEVAMEAVIDKFSEAAFRYSFLYAIKAREAQMDGLVNHPTRTARRAVSRHLRFELANWVLRRDYNWRFLVSSSP